MPHPIGYYCDSAPQISAIERQFGSQLEGLRIDQKREIQAVLAVWLTYGCESPLTLDDTPDLDVSNEAYDAIEMLQGISQQVAQSLVVALAIQLSQPK